MHDFLRMINSKYNVKKTMGAVALMVLFAICFIIISGNNRKGVILIELIIIALFLLLVLIIGRKKRRDILEFNNARMELMLSMIPGLLVENIDDINRVTIEGNASGLFDVLLGDVSKDEFLETIHPGDLIRYTISYRKAKAGETSIREEVRLKCKDGGYIWTECFFLELVNTDKERRIICAFHDIDKRKKDSQEKGNIIQSLGKQYCSLIMVDLMQNRSEVIKDERGLEMRIPVKCEYTRINKVFFGMRVCRESREYTTQQLSIENIQSQLSYLFPVMEVEYKRNLDRGRERWERVTIVEVAEQDGVASEVILAIKDITEQKKDEIESRQTLQGALDAAKAASNAKSDFLSKMSHDIRTPLNVMIGMADIAQRNAYDADKVKDCLYKISTSGNHLLNLVNEVLDMSMIESGSVLLLEDKIDLAKLIDEVRILVETRAAQKGHIFSVYMEELKHPLVIGDASRIQQILMNLLINAVKYTITDGVIKLTVRENATKYENIGCYEFIIEDNGVGMSEEFLATIYEPFSRAYDSRTSKAEGVGLGMAIVQNLVRLMNGNIHVESKELAGTRFVITLHLKRQEGETISDLTGAETNLECDGEDSIETDYSGRRLLLVEDNELNMEIMVDMLSTTKITVDTAENGREAVEKVSQSAEGYYDLIFMDVQMPELNGYEASDKIRKLNREDVRRLPIIALTANAFTEDVQRAKDAGMNDHVSKPVSLGQIISVMNIWLKNY